jgi:tetratricopeptide (TPR) repeat protein
MKNLILLLLIISISACSSRNSSKMKDFKIAESDWDALSDETFIRWDEERLRAVGDSPVVNCYQDKVQEGLEKFKKKYSAEGQEPYYWLHIGNCYFMDNKWSKAEFFYRLSLDQAKSKTIKSIALNNLAILQFQWEQWEKGKDYLKQSIALAPSFKVPKYNLSQLHIQFGLYDNAIAILKGNTFRDSSDVDIYHSLANAYLFKGDLEAANHYFELIPKNYFRRSDIAASYSLYQIRVGNFSKAKEILENRTPSSSKRVTGIIKQIEIVLSKNMK